MALEITKYGGKSELPTSVGDELAVLFANNYPPNYAPPVERNDLAAREDASAIQNLLNRGRTYYLGTAGCRLAGFLESRTLDQDDDTTVELMTWLMVDEAHRGNGVATRLHAAFIADAMLRARSRLPKPTVARLGVHNENPARAMYEHWGYSDDGHPESAPEIILMSKPLVPEL